MVHFSTGIDLVEINKIQGFLDRHKKYWDEIFTSRELKYCLKKKNSFQHLAVRFAAKEAMLKALGIGLLSGFKLKDIEIVNDICMENQKNWQKKMLLETFQSHFLTVQNMRLTMYS